MAKTIKLENHVYNSLHAFRDKDETLSQAVERLLATKEQLLQLASILEGRIKFLDWRREQFDLMTLARAERADLESRTIK